MTCFYEYYFVITNYKNYRNNINKLIFSKKIAIPSHLGSKKETILA